MQNGEQYEKRILPLQSVRCVYVLVNKITNEYYIILKAILYQLHEKATVLQQQ